MPPNTPQPKRIPPPPGSRIRTRFDQHGEIIEYELGPTNTAWARAWRYWLLAPTPELYEAMLRGERVPLEQLDTAGIKRLWKKPV